MATAPTAPVPPEESPLYPTFDLRSTNSFRNQYMLAASILSLCPVLIWNLFIKNQTDTTG